MTKPTSASDQGLNPHWKVRVAFPGSIIHLASQTEPEVVRFHGDHEIVLGVHADWITDHRYGDTLGHIRWRDAIAITWRWSP